MNQLKDKIFIAFEGIAGSGKSTQVDLLKQRIEEAHFGEVIVSKVYEKERKKITDAYIQSLQIHPTSIAMMFLFQMLHAKQYEEVKEALQKGKIVIADRWRETFWAYHSNFEPLSKMPKRMLKVLDQLAFQELNPHITFLLDLPVEEAVRRLSLIDRRESTVLLYPTEGACEHFQIMREYYIRIAKKKKWITIDASKSIQEIHEAVWRIITTLI